MIDGLTLSKKEFSRMKVADKLDILFENQQESLKLIRGYKWQIQAVSVTIFFLALGVTALLKAVFHIL